MSIYIQDENNIKIPSGTILPEGNDYIIKKVYTFNDARTKAIFTLNTFGPYLLIGIGKEAGRGANVHPAGTEFILTNVPEELRVLGAESRTAIVSQYWTQLCAWKAVALTTILPITLRVRTATSFGIFFTEDVDYRIAEELDPDLNYVRIAMLRDPFNNIRYIDI